MKSILQTNKECYLCRYTQGLDVHHVMNGPLRSKSEKWGGVIYLCRRCHDKVHRDPVTKTSLKQLFQYKFECLYGHELWMKEFHKNYVEDNE